MTKKEIESAIKYHKGARALFESHGESLSIPEMKDTMNGFKAYANTQIKELSNKLEKSEQITGGYSGVLFIIVSIGCLVVFPYYQTGIIIFVAFLILSRN